MYMYALNYTNILVVIAKILKHSLILVKNPGYGGKETASVY